jgi:hypothetical protein
MGVHFDRDRGKWLAFICNGGRFNNLGRFDRREDAVTARLEAEKRLWGIQPRRAEAHAP